MFAGVDDALMMGGIGALGALLTEAAEVHQFIRANAHPPWIVKRGWRGGLVRGKLQPTLATYALGVFLKVGVVAFGLVTLLAATHQISGVYGALVTGAAAIAIVTRLAAQADTPAGSALPATSNEGQPQRATRSAAAASGDTHG
jgi:hypothetical protein